MKKLSKLLFVLLAGAVAAPAFAANVNVGEVTFKGKITDKTCSIHAGDENKNVTMPTIAADQLDAPGKTAGAQLFTVQVENCPGEVKQVRASFRPDAQVDPVTGTLKNTDMTGAAKNVNIQLVNEDATVIKPGYHESAHLFPVDPNLHTGTMQYGGQYYATGTATAGTLTSVTTFDVDYN
ncbi:fimbrial protein [Paraburkholderia aspalathi]|uniref:fimbrial protein n=1 Tax=Paraburkholderia aspalathi TaxID=1324617 RepID=UPI0038BDE9C1